MRAPSQAFRQRLLVLGLCLLAAVLACVALALVVARHANETLRQLADVEFETALQAREFRAAVDGLHGALLRIGSHAAADSGRIITQQRQRLNVWLTERRAEARNAGEKDVLRRLDAELQMYFDRLDRRAEGPGGFGVPLDRDDVVAFDDGANRLQGVADDFAVVHDAELRDLLQASLGSVLWLRNLVFSCLALLLAATGAVVTLLYRDVVRPLREQLVESETLLVQREKLAALGTLAAGVAHEIRNPLTAIKARLYTLRRGLSAPEAHEDVQAITHEVNRLEVIVKDVLGYARPADPALGPVELAAWLREVARFVEPELTAQNIALSVEVPARAAVRADPDQLRQILLNLIRNAQDALRGRAGKIVLAVTCERSPLRGRLTDVAVLSVRDDGPGIPAEIQARLFDPFFTTKAAGTGLGLSIVARLVENQGGEITFQSAPRVGTRFAVHLRLSPTDEGARESR